MRELALFAGGGGGLLGTHHFLGWRTVAAVEIDPYRQDVLGARQRDGFLGTCPFPIFSDIRDFDGAEWRGRVDVISAGFPCTPFSSAGKRLGADDPRNMWPDTARVIREVRPRYVLLENSPKLASHPPRLAVVVALLDLLGGKKRRRVEHLFNPGGYLGTVLGDLAESGYDAEWDCFPAAALGAPHRRDRLWILAYANVDGRCRDASEGGEQRRQEGGEPDARGQHAGRLPDAHHLDADAPGSGASAVQQERWEPAGLLGDVPDADVERLRDERWRRARADWPGATEPGYDGAAGDVADADEERRERRSSSRSDVESRESRWIEPFKGDRVGWPAEPDVGRVAHGIAKRVDRLEALGDMQIPVVAAVAFRALSARAGLTW